MPHIGQTLGMTVVCRPALLVKENLLILSKILLYIHRYVQAVKIIIQVQITDQMSALVTPKDNKTGGGLYHIVLGSHCRQISCQSFREITTF